MGITDRIKDCEEKCQHGIFRFQINLRNTQIFNNAMRLSCHSHYFLTVTFLTTDLEAQAWQIFLPEQMYFRQPQLIRLSRINCISIPCVFLGSLNHVQSAGAGWIFGGCDSTKPAAKAFDSKQTQYECLPPKSGSEVHLFLILAFSLSFASLSDMSSSADPTPGHWVAAAQSLCQNAHARLAPSVLRLFLISQLHYPNEHTLLCPTEVHDSKGCL